MNAAAYVLFARNTIQHIYGGDREMMTLDGGYFNFLLFKFYICCLNIFYILLYTFIIL